MSVGFVLTRVEERLFDDHLTKIKAGEAGHPEAVDSQHLMHTWCCDHDNQSPHSLFQDLRKTARMNPKENIARPCSWLACSTLLVQDLGAA